MKLTEKFSSAQLLASSWPLFEQCSGALGVILDNKFEDPHITVYEHVRHTASEVFKHSDEFEGASPPPSLLDAKEMVEEERDVLGALLTPESGRRMNIIGDVGVGKTTFVKHVVDLHFGSADFAGGIPIYIGLADFTASEADPIADIRKRFVTSVSAQLERGLGIERLMAIDDYVFKNAEMFSVVRSMILPRLEERDRPARITIELENAIKTSPVELTIARINAVCKDDRNALLLVVDNIDHLPEVTLRALSLFLIEIQLATVPLLLVAMRDHTYNRGFSSYREDKTVPAWNLRLKPPNIKLMLERRIRHFLPNASAADAKVKAGAGILQIDRSTASVCRTLLNAPLSDRETYEFLCSYTNFNIRDLFANLQRIVGCPGFRAFDRDFFMSESPRIGIGIDECLIALGLERHLMFMPDVSTVFNPYSSGSDDHPLDKIVASRVIQLLDNRIAPIAFKDLSARLVGWGYNTNAIDAQVRAMINKDIVWTSSGAPSNFTHASEIRLSYRGQLYARKILRRTVFNYMMSFDIEAPAENHATYRHHNQKNEFRTELESFASFTAPFESEAIADRVLGLAEIIAEAERTETRQLLNRKGMDAFKADVAPKSVCTGILDGLSKFLERTLQKNGNGSRFQAPSTATVKRISEAHQSLRDEFRGVFQ